MRYFRTTMKIQIYSCLVLWILFVLYVYEQSKNSLTTEMDDDAPSLDLFRQLHDVGYEELVSLADEPNMQLIMSLFQLKSPGYNGTPVIIDVNKLPRRESLKYKRSLAEREFSSYISTLVPLQRHLPDIRLKECKKSHPDPSLPQVSVIIVFHNEHWSTLLRTVHSVLDNSPQHLLLEVILVDDLSTEDVLKEPLDEYVLATFGNVRIHRTETRHGIIRGRNLGFERSIAPVVVFMDSHCECFPGWLEPLVARIAENERLIVTPVIHGIQPITFGIDIQKDIYLHSMYFPELRLTRMKVSEDDLIRRKNPSDPYSTPATVGSAFAISRTWFLKLGRFDPGLEVWGGDNVELSLKSWMCGGSIEIIPCSNVGHMYPSNKYYRTKFFSRNVARVANVWLDDFNRNVVNYDGKVSDIGDLTEQVNLRKNLNCSSFAWYLKTVSPQTYVVGNGIYTNDIRNIELNDLCIDGVPDSSRVFPVIASRCRHHQNNQQRWDLTEQREIRNQMLCLEEGGGPVSLSVCTKTRGNQTWWVVDTGMGTLSIVSISGQCLSVDTTRLVVITERCEGRNLQRWKWKKTRS